MAGKRSMATSEPWSEPWSEPTAALRLRWGRSRERYLAGIVLAATGSLAVQASTSTNLLILLHGSVAVAVGWSIMPSKRWRRITVFLPALLQPLLLLSGPQSVWSLTITLACWLLVRHRPARSWVTLVFPIATGFLLPQFFVEYGGMPVALAIATAVLVASAWLARGIAAAGGGRNTLPSPSDLR